MGFVLTIAAGFVVWIVLWSLDVKGFDAFMLTTLIIVLGATARMVAPSQPSRHE